MWTPEKQFVLSCLRSLISHTAIPEISKFLDWVKIDKIAEINGVIPLIQESLTDQEAKIPSEIYGKWKDIRHEVLKSNLAYMAELKKISSLYSSNDLVLLKGLSLLNTVYSDISLRLQSDMDILVKEKNRELIFGILKETGYKQYLGYENMFRRGPLIIDVHFDLLKTRRIKSRSFIFNMPYEYSNGFSLEYLDGYKNVLALCPSDNLIFYSIHTLKHSYMQWIWLFDSALIIKKYWSQAFAEQIRSKSLALGALRPLAYMAELLDFMFDIKCPEISEFQTKFSGIEKRVISWVKEDKKVQMCGQILFFSMIHGLLKKILFAFEIIFLRPRVLKESSGIKNDILVFFYYPVRLLKIFCYIFVFLTNVFLRDNHH